MSYLCLLSWQKTNPAKIAFFFLQANQEVSWGVRQVPELAQIVLQNCGSGCGTEWMEREGKVPSGQLLDPAGQVGTSIGKWSKVLRF